MKEECSESGFWRRRRGLDIAIYELQKERMRLGERWRERIEEERLEEEDKEWEGGGVVCIYRGTNYQLGRKWVSIYERTKVCVITE